MRLCWTRSPTTNTARYSRRRCRSRLHSPVPCPPRNRCFDLLFVGPQSYCFTAGRGVAHVEQMLEILASVRTCPDQPFQALEHLVLRHAEAVSGCIWVLVAWDEARREFVRKLKELGVPVLALVILAPGRTKSWTLARSTTSRTASSCSKPGRLKRDWQSSNDEDRSSSRGRESRSALVTDAAQRAGLDGPGGDQPRAGGYPAAPRGARGAPAV